MLKFKKYIGFFGLLFVSMQSFADTLQVNSLRYWTEHTKARLVLDVSTSPNHDLTLLQNPPRLIVNLKNAMQVASFKQPSGGNRFFSAFKTTSRESSDLSVIIELKRNVSYKSFSLGPNGSYGHRLVLDVFDTGSPEVVTANRSQVERTAAKTNVVKDNKEEGAVIKTAHSTVQDTNKIDTSHKEHSRQTGNRKASRNIVVAIDAGHGGKDPGSHGRDGTLEKEVVFDIAKKLEQLIAKQPGMTPVMIRNGDYFIKLRQRMQKARDAKADLFVSIHADAFANSSARGSSVFTLSNRGASSEAARWLANNENAADLVGGVSLDDKDDVLASVLLDLSQTATTEASGHVAKNILSNFKQINPLHKSSVQKAGFMVLKSPDIPSILVETAFISNPEEEVKLRSTAHQSKVARAIFNGIVGYFKQFPPLPSPTRIADAAQLDNG